MKILYDIIDNVKNINDRGVGFVINRDKCRFLPYEDLYQESLGVYSYLSSKGIKKGEKLIFQFKDNYEFITCFWGCVMGGIIPVPISYDRKIEYYQKLIYVWNAVDRCKIVASDGVKDNIDSFLKEFDMEDDMLRSIIPYQVKKDKIEQPVQDIDEEDIAYIQFSSGSTGKSKGVMLTHKNLLSNITAIHKRFKMTDSDKALSWMPLTHDMGLIVAHLVMLFARIDNYFIPTRVFVRNPSLWINTASEKKITILYSPNFGYQHYLNYVKESTIKDLDLSEIRLILNGAEPISATLCYKFLDALKEANLKSTTMTTVYGLAEGTVGVACPDTSEDFEVIYLDRRHLNIGQSIVEARDKINEISFIKEGKPLDSCKVRIANEDEVYPERVVGQIQLRGVSITQGYVDSESETKKLFTSDGWLKTGDLGFFMDGQLVVTGRKKDLIIINGINYYAHDIEHLAEEVDEVDLGKVVAVSNHSKDKNTEEIALFILTRHSIEEFASLAKKLKEHIGNCLGVVPRYVIPIERIPKTTSGKVKRFELQQELESGKFDSVINEVENVLNKYSD